MRKHSIMNRVRVRVRTAWVGVGELRACSALYGRKKNGYIFIAYVRARARIRKQSMFAFFIDPFDGGGKFNI